MSNYKNPLDLDGWRKEVNLPVHELSIGSYIYSGEEMLMILNLYVQSDPSVILAQQILVAKLNLLTGRFSNLNEISKLISKAEGALICHLPVPLFIDSETWAGQTMMYYAKLIEKINKSKDYKKG